MAYSYVTYTGNGSTTQFTVPFGYIRREHVFATVATVAAAFTWVNDSLIQMTTAPANGAAVRVYRQTPLTAPLVDFADGATLVAADLDTNASQSIYTQQELDDSLVGVALGAIPNGDKGDIVTSVGGTVWTVDSDLASRLSFTQTGAGTVARTVDNKLKDVVHVKDLGCICNGVADDGATLNAAIYARYNGLATSQRQEYVEIHASAGDVLKFVTPVTVRQNRIRFIGNGAKIVCTGQYAFDFTQDSSGNINEDGGVIGWKITGATLMAIRGRACAFTRIENNWFTGNNAAIDLQAIGAIIRGNYIRENTGAGITLQSAIVVGGGRSESQRCVVEQNRVYINGGIGIFLKDGGGHYLGGNDLEVNTSAELLVRSSFGNTIVGLYSEPTAGIPIIQIDNASTDVAGRTSESNQIIGGTFGGGAVWDINISGGNGTVVSGVRFGTGNVNISAGVNNTVLLPCNGNTPTVTNNGNGTLDMTAPGKIKMYASATNRILVDAVNAIGGVISGPDNVLHFAGIKGISTSQTNSRNLFGFVDIAGTATSANVTFGTAEPDSAYGVTFGVLHTVGTPASGSEAVYMTARATGGFTINVRTAPGTSNTVRVHWMLMR
jgi:hypothetical protein